MSHVPGLRGLSPLALKLVLFGSLAGCVALSAGPAWAGAIHHVKADATGANNGQSWADAYTDLQAALAAAAPGDEIWVAQGTYRPTTGTLRTVSFALKEGVGLYGGFAGAETERDLRDWKANATILSGDIGTTATTDNSYHVVVGADLAVLDGFTITGGNAKGPSSLNVGGGMYNPNCSPTVTNCTFSGNWAYDGRYGEGSGGGIYNSGGSPTVTNCTFSGNTAWYSGGMCNSGGSPTVTNCAFNDNTVGMDGGGMCNWSSSATVINCTFSGNTADREGTTNGSGGGMCNSGGSPTVINCAFTGNTVGGTWGCGGGIYSDDGSPTVIGCAFSGNSAWEGGGMYNGLDGNSIVTNCTFNGNTATNLDGGGMYNWCCSPTVTNCTFSGNTAPCHDGGGMYNIYSLPTVTDCTFSGNTASQYGGGMHNFGSLPDVRNCTFSGNMAVANYGSGGGMYNTHDGSPTVTNCTFSGNTARNDGGGILNWGSSLTLANCTFSGNSADGAGGAMYNGWSSPPVTNCIFWNNAAVLGAETYNVGSGAPTFSHCDITGSGGSGPSWDAALGVDGGGNIAADPLFLGAANPAGPDGLWRTRDDGLRLRSNSPCMGAADPAVAPPTDILGVRRKTTPDIGAYEFDWTRTRADPVWMLFR